MSGVVAGSLERKEQLLEEILVEQCRAKQGVAATSRRYHVATSPSHDVESIMQKVSNLATSRRHHVATSAQKSASHHLMIEGSKIRASRSVRGEARISRARGSRLREITRDSYHFPFLLDIIEDMMMMFLILDTLFFSFMMF